jgi:glucoamylase
MRTPYKLLFLFVLALFLTSGCAWAQSAFGRPGSMPTWTSGGKEAVGTAVTTESKVWFTLENGVMTEAYYPRLDTADVRTLEFGVSDGQQVWLESKDMRHSVEQIDGDALVFRQTNRDPDGRFQIQKVYVTDPRRDTVLINVTFSGGPKYSLYVLYDPSLKNSGYGDTGYLDGEALVAMKADVASALLSSSGFEHASSGFAGASDGYTDLLLHHRLDWSYTRAENGNVIQTAKVGGEHFTLALGFGPTASDAHQTARASLGEGFAAISAEYANGWHQYVQALRPVASPYAHEFRLAAMVLKAHEDKTYRGAMIASMSIPWGNAVRADKPTVGGYHLIWARDLYEVATALLAAGDRAAAERALNYLFTVQQKPDGSFPQNSWLDGKPYWTALQMDEVSYPMILAWQLGKTDPDTWTHHVRPEAEFVVAHGPATQEERWEEVAGYSPSTVAAEIAGLVCAADIARTNSAEGDARRYLQTADEWNANLEKWLVTSTGHLKAQDDPGPYYMRIDNDTNPNDGSLLDVRNGGGVWDEREVVDAGFLELVRLGIRPASDRTIERSVKIVDSTIRVETPNGPSFHRYSHDGYGETFFGGPWLGGGIGRVWPIFTGERGEYEVALGQDPTPYLQAMLHFANRGGMIPEQVWDRAEPTSSGFVFGQGTGSATPLAWSMAQFVRLVMCAQEKKIVEQPSIVAARFLGRSSNVARVSESLWETTSSVYCEPYRERGLVGAAQSLR